VVAGPQYPADIQWLANVDRAEHLAAREHRRFYNSQNVTRQDMVRAGFSLAFACLKRPHAECPSLRTRGPD
jgi:hypothetical protein